jgi:hypothetical protein
MAKQKSTVRTCGKCGESGHSIRTCQRVARITAKHPGDRKEDSGLPPETSAVPIGSRFERLRIGNTFFERLELAPDYFCRPEHACWSGLQGALENEQDRELLAPLASSLWIGFATTNRTGHQDHD